MLAFEHGFTPTLVSIAAKLNHLGHLFSGVQVLSDEVRRIALSAIVIDRPNRQRENLDDLEELASSIKSKGLFHPVIIDRQYRLVAGERRIEATRSLGETDILCRFVEDLSETERQIIELEENIKRKDLEWKDLVRAIFRIHSLFIELDPEWTQAETAEECNITQGLVSQYLRIAKELDDPRIKDCGSVNEARNILLRREQRAAGDALMELIEVPLPNGLDETLGPLPAAKPQAYPAQPPVIAILPPEETILHADFLQWAPLYAGRKFSFLHVDFPYGIDVFSGPQARGSEPTAGYGDSQRLYENLVTCMCKNLDKLMALSAHMMFWYSDKHRELTRNMFARLAPSLSIHPYPLIWVKSDNAGIASDPKHGPRHIYETALLMTRSSRQIVKVVSDAYVAPTDKILHPSTKPAPMLRHFFSMFVDQTSTVFDPTCGSGASIRAAESLDAKFTLGLEIDEQFVKPARHALAMERLKVRASKVL